MFSNELRFGSIGSRALHIAIDMQRLFAEPGEFYCSDFEKNVFGF
ncbi:hypothetical protein [Endozoicomonas sp. Mp262]